MRNLLTTFGLTVLAVLALVTNSVTALFGQENRMPEAKPALDKSLTDQVDKLFAQWDKPDSPGCALGIVKDGRLIYKRGYGMANLDYNIPITSKSVFDVKAISMQFTAMSILLLAKRGKLSLDDEIQKYVPEVPRYQSPITIRHLIHHTSGIRELDDLTALAGMEEDVRLIQDDYIGLLARQKQLNHEPGEEFLFTDSGYFLLPIIVKRVSGKSLGEFAEENIFKPLGMTNTHFHDNRNLAVKNRVTGFAPDKSSRGFAVVATADDPVDVATGLYTTIDDLLVWDQNFSNNRLGGGPDLIKEALSTGTLNNGEKVIFAFGLFVQKYKGLKRVSMKGGGIGFQSVVLRFPEQNFSVICLCNASGIDVWGLAFPVADIFLADHIKKVAEPVKETSAAAPDIISMPQKELTGLAGLYVDQVNVLRQLRVYMENGKLLYRAGQSVRQLSPVSKNRFRVVGVVAPVGVELVFERSTQGEPMKMKLVISGSTTIFDAVNTETPTSAQFVEFTGKYISDELPGATYTLIIKDGNLILHVRNGISVFSDKPLVLAWAQSGSKSPEDNLLTPVFADAFSIFGEGVMRFTRNRQNVVSGFVLTAGNKVRNLRFDKR